MMSWMGNGSNDFEERNRVSSYRGYLYKLRRSQNLLAPQWGKRWFSIEAHFLKWYRNESDLCSSGMIDLKYIRSIMKLENQSTPFTFTIVSEERNIVLRCTSMVEMNNWIRALHIHADIARGGTGMMVVSDFNQMPMNTSSIKNSASMRKNAKTRASVTLEKELDLTLKRLNELEERIQRSASGDESDEEDYDKDHHNFKSRSRDSLESWDKKKPYPSLGDNGKVRSSPFRHGANRDADNSKGINNENSLRRSFDGNSGSRPIDKSFDTENKGRGNSNNIRGLHEVDPRNSPSIPSKSINSRENSRNEVRGRPFGGNVNSSPRRQHQYESEGDDADDSSAADMPVRFAKSKGSDEDFVIEGENDRNRTVSGGSIEEIKISSGRGSGASRARSVKKEAAVLHRENSSAAGSDLDSVNSSRKYPDTAYVRRPYKAAATTSTSNSKGIATFSSIEVEQVEDLEFEEFTISNKPVINSSGAQSNTFKMNQPPLPTSSPRQSSINKSNSNSNRSSPRVQQITRHKSASDNSDIDDEYNLPVYDRAERSKHVSTSSPRNNQQLSSADRGTGDKSSFQNYSETNVQGSKVFSGLKSAWVDD